MANSTFQQGLLRFLDEEESELSALLEPFPESNHNNKDHHHHHNNHDHTNDASGTCQRSPTQETPNHAYYQHHNTAAPLLLLNDNTDPFTSSYIACCNDEEQQRFRQQLLSDEFEPLPIAPSRIIVVPKLESKDLFLQTHHSTNQGMLEILQPLVAKDKQRRWLAPSCDEHLRQHKRSKRETLQCKSMLTSWPLPMSPASTSSSSSTSPVQSDSSMLIPNTAAVASTNIRQHQETRWSRRFKELSTFQQRHGHCAVPYTFKEFPQLAQWVKRQRYQFKLKTEGRHCTLTDDRQQILDEIGFVWDSHHALWEEKFQDLVAFHQSHGHCLVPARYEPSPALAIWVKCQRRQCKLLQEGRASNITHLRIERLDTLGFAWNPRPRK